LNPCEPAGLWPFTIVENWTSESRQHFAACLSIFPEARTRRMLMNHGTSQSRSLEDISNAFDDAWARGDVDTLVSLYAPDATIESPLIPVLMRGKREGICRGHDEIRALVRAVLERGAEWGQHEPPVVRGNTMYVEYRRVTPERVQLDYVDVLEVNDGLI